ncbi:unnamed protein product [Lactuca saligna]|uniref:Uncharacterized protein n=1 Tax=Lactuca saligna TaxID=75948 RepID=A0AA36E3D1_LACSI|nr:unnamed protein product [Lactuca saligna]
MVGNERGHQLYSVSMNHRRAESISTPFFVTNFPREANVKTSWEACDKVGRVVDVYVARKLSKLDDGDAPLAVKGVCIKTGKPFFIQDTIKVVAQGVEYGVVVCEISKLGTEIMEEGEIGSDIPDLSGGEEEVACFDDDVNDFINLYNDYKVDEGHENSFRMDNTPINGVRGVGFVDRNGIFFQTNNKRKGDGVVDRRSCMPNVAVTRGVAENKCNPMMPSTVMENGCKLHGDSPHLVDDVDGEGVAE